MGKEIERKFLVKDEGFVAMASGRRVIKQGYLSSSLKATVRVRIADDRGYVTIKSKTRGIERDEWEYEVPLDDAEGMMALCQHTIAKIRYLVPYQGHVWEVDVFEGRHQGLVIAEVELRDAQEAVAIPAFIGDEVTGIPIYYNSYLASH